MNTIGATPAPAVGGRQVGQLLAGRYRLAMFKGGDDIADVWHALDESTDKVVTLEILREHENVAARQRFLAEAQRMAAIERPSVMRVSAIHNEATDTFIVFEHLIPLPVVLTGLTALMKDARSKGAEEKDKTIVITPVAPHAPPPIAPSMLAAVVGPKRSAATTDPLDEATEPTIIDLDEMPEPPPSLARTVLLPEGVQAASRSLQAARSDLSGVLATARSFVADARVLIRDDRPGALLRSARARIPQRFDMSIFTPLVTAATARARQVATARAPQLASGAARLRASMPREVEPAMRAAARVGALALSSARPVVKSLAATAAPYIGRARENPVALAGATAVIFLAIFVVSPLDDMLTDAFRSSPTSSATATPTAALAPAPFVVPPLAAYGAAFDSQGAYPTTAPNGTVEWVVALRNTGSAGWYRGIDGAQAAIALADGAGVAVQSTSYVAPGQVGWFVVRFPARAEVGTYTVQLRPRIDGRGLLPDLGIFVVVTVSKNP